MKGFQYDNDKQIKTLQNDRSLVISEIYRVQYTLSLRIKKILKKKRFLRK